MRILTDVTADFREFWTERHLGTLVTVRGDGSPHVVPVGIAVDVDAGIARVICSGGSQKARNAAARLVAVVSQVDGRRWSTLEGVAVVRSDSVAVAAPSRATPAATGCRGSTRSGVVIEIAVGRVLG